MKIKDFLIVGLVIVIIFLFTCNKEVVEKPVKVYRVDSIFTHTTDTFKEVIRVPIASVPLIKETPQIDLSDTTELNTGLRTFHYGKRDSLITYNIYVKSECRPEKVDFEYDITQFTIRDSIKVYVRDSTHTESVKSYMSLGATMIGSGDHFGFSPMLQYSHKKGNTYSVGYDVINGHFMVGFSKRLSFRK